MTRSASTEDLEDRLRVEFVDDARDRLQVMYDALDGLAKGERSEVSVIGVIRLETHNFKGMGTSFGFPTVSLIAHRLEDYMSGLTARRRWWTAPNSRHWPKPTRSSARSPSAIGSK